ncbi:hypothetical protein Tco_0369456 [Tanacetum coccineum]
MRSDTPYPVGTVFRELPYSFDSPMRRLTMEEILAKFIDEVKGVTTRGGKMTSEATHSKEINETGINKNEPPRFKQDVQEKPHDDGVENKSSSILEKATHPLVKLQRSSIPFPNRKHKEVEDLAAYHLSRFESPHMEVLTEREIADKFSDEHLMELKSKSNNDEPCESRLMQLNELAELRDSAYENTRIYKERTKKWHNSRLRGDKDFKDLVKEISTNIGGEFTNLEILKCWSLDNFKSVVQHEFLLNKLNMENLPSKHMGVSHSNSF